MSIVVLYILCICAIFANFIVGTSLKNYALKLFKQTEGMYSNKKITGNELILTLNKHTQLKNLKLTKLKARKTNYYSFKYNVIKLSPVTFASYELSQLSISANCFMQAKLAQHHTIFYMFKLFFIFVSKIISAIFLPLFLICAIINKNASTHTAYFLILFSLIAFVLCMLIQLVDFLINIISSKKILGIIKSTNKFSVTELEIMQKQLTAVCKILYYDYSRYTILLFHLISPDALIQINNTTN